MVIALLRAEQVDDISGQGRQTIDDDPQFHVDGDLQSTGHQDVLNNVVRPTQVIHDLWNRHRARELKYW